MKSNILTKSDFLSFCVCSKDFWLRKNRPDIYRKPELTLFFQKLIREGYEVEKYAKQLFKDAEFQKQVKTQEGFYAELDIYKDGNIYEVKSSSEIKTDLIHNHIKDITFQTIVAEKSGLRIKKSFIVHINKKYIRGGEINPFDLLEVKDVTERVREEKGQVELMMNQALKLMNEEEVDISKCDCIYKSAGQRCDSFSVLNPNIPEYSIHNIFQGNKIKELIAMEVYDPKDVPEDFDMTDRQREKIYLQKIGKPNINTTEIKEKIEKFIYPIYFLDYESINKPVPLLDGYKPNQHLVFQYSLHKLNEDGKLEHFEYLAYDFENATSGLVKNLQSDLGPIGTIISWHDLFEKSRNKELAKLHPECKIFFDSVNNRIFDLKVIFQKDYLHPDFKGSASIKKVLPVLLPELSYKKLNIQDGTMAMTAFEEMVEIKKNKKRSMKKLKRIKENLLKYCKLDTLAMVLIYKFLKDLNN